MRKIVSSLVKVSLILTFWFVINEAVSLLFGNMLPLPTPEDSSIIFLYLLIFVLEVMLSYILTSLLFRFAKDK